MGGGGGKSMMPPPSSATPRPSGGSMPPPPPTRTQLPNYNRYDQEQFHGKDTHGFNIDTQQTFSGMTLKSVTEGSQAQRNKQAAALQQQMQNSSSGGRDGGGHTPNISGGTGTPKTGSASPGGGSNSKRPSRTPIIIIPAAPKSLVTMYNAKDVLQDLRYVNFQMIYCGRPPTFGLSPLKTEGLINASCYFQIYVYRRQEVPGIQA